MSLKIIFYVVNHFNKKLNTNIIYAIVRESLLVNNNNDIYTLNRWIFNRHQR